MNVIVNLVVSPIKSLKMSNIRGRFPGRPLSARRSRSRQRVTNSDLCNSSGGNAFETAKQIQRGIQAFNNTFPVSSSFNNSQNVSMVRHDFYQNFGGRFIDNILIKYKTIETIILCFECLKVENGFRCHDRIRKYVII